MRCFWRIIGAMVANGRIDRLQFLSADWMMGGASRIRLMSFVLTFSKEQG